MAHSDAYERFMKSTVIGFDQWHDGIGYDLDAFQAMTQEEQAEVIQTMKAKGASDWRDIEVFELAQSIGGTKKTGKDSGTAALTALKKALKAKDTDIRLHAAVALRDMGELPDFAKVLAKELGKVENFNRLSYALNAIDAYKPEIRDALLRGARDRPEVAVHFAAKLCQLAGKTKTDFDWNMRPFFLRFGEDSPPEERKKAYQELLKLIGAKDPK